MGGHGTLGRVMAPSWLGVLDDLIGVCTAHRRPDLAHRLHQKRARLLDPQLRVHVVGTPNQGKSQLINALVNAPVCAVGDDLTTSAPTVVQHADAPSAALITDPGPFEPRRAITGGPGERVQVPIDEVTRQVGGRAGTRLVHELVRAEIGIPRKLLASGLILVDTPAITGTSPTGDPHRTLAAVDQADAVVFASDATGELSAIELELLAAVCRACPNVIVALTKIDLVPRWRQVAEANRALLAAARVAARLIPLSATLRLAAAHTGDTAINAESGFPELITSLQRQVLAKSEEVAPRAVGAVSAATIGVLATGLRTALTAVATPAGPDLNAQVATAQRAMDALRKHTGRSQTVLGDHMADLTADVEHDLRDRTRKILREVDAIFDEADPKDSWDQFAEWLRENLTDAAESNFGWLIERCQWVADRVAASFPADDSGGSDTPADALLARAEDPLRDADDLGEPRLEPFSAGQRIFTGLRGSYGGVLMFGLITSLAGLPLINPISLGAGAVFGGKSIKDEGDMRLKRRQAAAKAAAQRHVDDVFLACGKESRDLIRRVQRTLRDHVTERAETLAERITEATRATQQAAQLAAANRDRQDRHLRGQLEQLAALHHRALTLSAVTQVAAPPRGLELSA